MQDPIPAPRTVTCVSRIADLGRTGMGRRPSRFVRAPQRLPVHRGWRFVVGELWLYGLTEEQWNG